MALPDIEVGLGELEREVHDAVPEFAEDVLRPAGRQLDRLPDPAAVVAPDSLLWSVFERHRAPNFPPAYGQVVAEIPKTAAEKPQARFLLDRFAPEAPGVFVETR
jgi:hypothetical protein